MNELSKYTDEDLKALVSADIETELRRRGYEYGWHKSQLYAGVIYILVNPAFPSLVKIGYADDVEKRLRLLNRNSGLPDPYHCFATYKVKKRLEDLKLHSLIDALDSDLRHTSNREFYEMSKEKAFGILQAIAEINGDEGLLVRDPLGDGFFSEAPVGQQEDESGTTRRKRSASPRPVSVRFRVRLAGREEVVDKPFSTWRQLMVDACELIIQTYGGEAFEGFVLDQTIGKLHSKRRHMFGATPALMISFTQLSDGVYVNTNNSSDRIMRVMKVLTERFPDVRFELVYGGSGVVG